jgi:PIN domain nuclease of toxin-antitoxin system
MLLRRGRVRAGGVGLRGAALSLLLDTHVWLWWLTGNPALDAGERDALDRSASKAPPALAAVSLWEAQMLTARGRIRLREPFGEWIRRVSAPEVVTLLPLDVEVVAALDGLPPHFHGDPADRLIVATARAHALALATHDTAIRRARVVRLWKP